MRLVGGTLPGGEEGALGPIHPPGGRRWIELVRKALQEPSSAIQAPSLMAPQRVFPPLPPLDDAVRVQVEQDIGATIAAPGQCRIDSQPVRRITIDRAREERVRQEIDPRVRPQPVPLARRTSAAINFPAARVVVDDEHAIVRRRDAGKT